MKTIWLKLVELSCAVGVGKKQSSRHSSVLTLSRVSSFQVVYIEYAWMFICKKNSISIYHLLGFFMVSFFCVCVLSQISKIIQTWKRFYQTWKRFYSYMTLTTTLTFKLFTNSLQIQTIEIYSTEGKHIPVIKRAS